MRFSYIFMFILVEVLDSPAYLEDFQEVELKDEPLEYDAVSCEAILAFVLNSTLVSYSR